MDVPMNKVVEMTVEEIGKKDNGCYLFYDWFCKTESLKNKCRKLLGTVRSIVKEVEKSKIFDLDNTSVFFANNCPCYGDGRLYDDLRICDLKSGKVLFNVCPRDPFGNAMLYYNGHGFESDTEGIKFSSVRELVKWFGNSENALAD